MSASSAPEKGATLAQWLTWIEATHPNDIEMGLERARDVALQAKLLPVSVPIVTVAGTNGKGSTVAMVDAIYNAAGFKTGVYTSPHIINFNERVAINGQPVSDVELVSAFEIIEAARGDTPLTYFEFSTLAAMGVFIKNSCDVIVLEVGLGGRLDTTNVWDTSCAVVTSIAIDHESWLGSDRSSIGLEKIGIGRAGIPLIMGDQDLPESVLQQAVDAGMDVQQVPPSSARELLKLSLAGEHQQTNAYAALTAVANLHAVLPVKLAQAKVALSTVELAGRFERLQRNEVKVVLDVAHNPAAALSVVAGFDERFPDAPVFAVFGALNDKDVSGVVQALNVKVQHWHCITLPGERGTQAQALCATVCKAGGSADAHDSISVAWKAAYEQASDYNSNHPLPEAVVLVAGSFFTLTALHEHWNDVGRNAN